MSDDLSEGVELPAESDAFGMSAAEAHAVALSPKLVELCQDDPELLQRLARGQLAIVQDRLVRKVLNNPDVTPAQLAIVHERLSKISRVEGTPPAAGGAGQQVTINIIRAPGKDQVVIEGEAKRLEGGSHEIEGTSGI